MQTNLLEFLTVYLFHSELKGYGVSDPVPFVRTRLVCLQIPFSHFVCLAFSLFFVTILLGYRLF
jgi:hypothetical protein